ncbi:MAG: hypothetical protein Q9182_001545 [Xanthomendoza sp. 2 TL-2023]
MATQQRPPAAHMSVGGSILSRMLQLEKQSKQYRTSSANPTKDANSNPLAMNPPVAAISVTVPAARPAPQKSHTTLSPAAVRQSRSVPPVPTSQAAPSPKQRPRSPSKPAANPTSEVSLPRPSAMSRAQTLPALSIDVKASGGDGPNRGSDPELAGDEESVISEICQSPSWSDFGGAKRKKEKKRNEKERKEEEKRLKKEEARQKAADLKAGKRLSKRPPPAAMETQKMPSRLRRNSIISFISSHSSSGENSRSHSREGKRLSLASIDSLNGNQRSHSTPATSTELRPESSEGWNPVVSPVAPQLPRLPRLGWHSRSGSSGTDKSKSWGSDDQYEKELVNFAYQFQATANASAPKDIVLGNVKVNQVSLQHSPKRPSGAWPVTRSQTEPELARTKGVLKVTNTEHLSTSATRESSEDSTTADGQMGNQASHLDIESARPQNGDLANDPQRRRERPGGDTFGRVSAAKMIDKLGIRHAPAARRNTSLDGTSYVHKQRMHQQQLSIAGFEDEQAVRIANERNLEEDMEEGEEGEEGEAEKEEQEEQEEEEKEEKENEFHEAQEPAAVAEEVIVRLQQQEEPPKEQLDKPQIPPPSLEVRSKTQENLRNQPASQDSHTSKDFRTSPATAPSSTSRNSTMDKLLGFKRRQKSDHGRLSIPGNNLALDKKALLSPPPPPPKETSPPPVPSPPKGKLESVKALKVIETTWKGQHKRRSESVEIVTPQERAEEPKPAPTHSHSRTRTSSSQLLNEDVNLSRPLPRSTTAPVLSPEMKIHSALSDKSRNESPSRSERKSVTFERSVADALAATQDQNKAPARAPEIIVETVSPEGLTRKTSIKRPRSNPDLQVAATNAPNLQLAASNAQLPSLDFLPQLKHQPLPKRTPNRASFMPSPERAISAQFPASSSLALKPTPDPSAPLPLSNSSPNLANVPGALFRPGSYAGPATSAEMSLRPSPLNTRRRTLSPNAATHLSRTSVSGVPDVFGRTPTPSESVNAKPMAKLFVICCKCNYWHDLPSHLYEAMCTPKGLTRDPQGKGEGPKVLDVKDGKKKVAEATLETMVKCPWCEHFMTTGCCAGWTAVLYLQERHH